METARTVWNLFLFFSLLAFPQFLGVLAYLLIRKYQGTVAHLAGFLIPPVLFFYFSWLFWVYQPQHTHPHEGCGMAAVAAAFIVLLGTAAQTITSLILQLVLRGRRPAP